LELLNFLEPLFLNPLFRFFVYMALIQILVQVFLDRKPAFWIASIATTYFWVKSFEPLTPLKGWAIILGFLTAYFLIKQIFRINLFLLLKGKKRCSVCYSEVHRKALVCPFCHHRFAEKESEEAT
jgi:predicted membrane protein